MKRTHTIDIYDPGTGNVEEDTHGNAGGSWALLHMGVKANLQPLTGSVTQTAAGREINSTWKGFIPPGITIGEDFGIVVTEGVGPERYRVTQVGEQGGKWDTELMLKETPEVFPDEEEE